MIRMVLEITMVLAVVIGIMVVMKVSAKEHKDDEDNQGGSE